MSSSPATYISKLQKVQNKALRFIYNYEITDYVPSQFMHLQANIDPLNVRLSKLSRKALFKRREYFFPSEDEPPDPPYLKNSPLLQITIMLIILCSPLRSPKQNL